VARPLEQQNKKDQHQRDRRYRQARGPGHAAADPPQQRAAHQDGNDDIELQLPSPSFVQRDPPTPTPKLPPIFMQVEDPSILIKPAPYSAQGFAAVFAGRSGTDAAGLSGLRSRDCCADAADADNTARKMTEKIVRIRRFYRGRRALAIGRI
jgi:hypothetical protein